MNEVKKDAIIKDDVVVKVKKPRKSKKIIVQSRPVTIIFDPPEGIWLDTS